MGGDGGRQALGRRGEELAAQLYAARGAQVLERNWRCRHGELDLVVREPDGTLVFCEVKTRSGTGFGSPADAITHAKGRRLRLLAGVWLSERAREGRSWSGVRIDVVAVLLVPGRAPQVELLAGVLS